MICCRLICQETIYCIKISAGNYTISLNKIIYKIRREENEEDKKVFNYYVGICYDINNVQRMWQKLGKGSVS